MNIKRAPCILGTSWILVVLLVTNHLPLPLTRNSLHVVDGGVTQSAKSAVNQSVLFADDFERGTEIWQLHGDWSIQTDDGNHILRGIGDDHSFAKIDSGGDDYRLETRIRVQSGETRLAIRLGQYDAGYYLTLEADGGAILSKWDGAGWTMLGSDPGPYAARAWYTVALAAEGDQLRGYINDALVIQATDTDYTSGSAMLAVAFGEADFDNVWMTGNGPQVCPVVSPNGLNCPFGLAFDDNGTVLVASAGHISRVAADGEVTHIAQATSPGEIVVGPTGIIYLVSELDNAIYTIAPDGSLVPFVTDLQNPWFLDLGPDGYLYASEDWTGTVRINPDTGAYSTWLPDLRGPIIFTGAGDAYLRQDNIIYHIAADKTVTTAAELPSLYPHRQYTGLARDAVGNFYVGEAAEFQRDPDSPPWFPAHLGEAVYKITPAGDISTFATGLGGVWDLAFRPDGDLYATEHDFGGLAKIASDGTVTTIVQGNGLCTAHAVAYNSAGTLYSLSLDNYLLMKREAGASTLEAIGSGFNSPSGDARGPALLIAPNGDVYVAEAAVYGPSRITHVADGTATVVTTDVDGPSGLAFDATDTLYTTEGPVGQLTRVNNDGATTPLVSGLKKPQGLAYGPDGLFYVAEFGADRVSAWDAMGTLSATFPISQPIGVTFVDNTLYVSAETGDIWRRNGSGAMTFFAARSQNAAGITPHPEGGVTVAFGGDNSIYRFSEETAAPAMEFSTLSPVLADAGTTVTHTITLRNTGNGRDGVWLAATSALGWPVSIQGGEFVAPLDCGGERSMYVTVSVPTGFPAGTRDTLTLTATSRLDPTVIESTHVATVVAFDIYLPIILKK
jgi:glucose/arabinose dehydrogenase